MALARKLMTADELLRLPDDGQRHELIGGELRTLAPSGAEHGELAIPSGSALSRYVRAHRPVRVFGAETGFLLATDPDLVRAPDTAFVSRERALAAGRVTGCWPGAPDLAVEVVSPNDSYSEVAEEVDTWLAHGTRMVIVINPRGRTVTVRQPAGQIRHLTVADTLDGADVVPGWALPVRELFATDDD